MHAERQITDLSVKHSFTLYPSLSPYGQTELQTEWWIHSLRMGWRNLFFSCAVVLCQFYGHLAWGHREPRRHALGAPLTCPWNERAKPPRVGQRRLIFGCCCVLWMCCVAVFCCCWIKRLVKIANKTLSELHTQRCFVLRFWEVVSSVWRVRDGHYDWKKKF
jgi:hypothetical protein